MIAKRDTDTLPVLSFDNGFEDNVRPEVSTHFICTLLCKMGQYFLDIQYWGGVKTIESPCKPTAETSNCKKSLRNTKKTKPYDVDEAPPPPHL